MILKDLINQCNTESVINKLMELYPDQVDLRNEYVKLLNKLKNLEPNMESEHEGGQLTLYVSRVQEEIDDFSYDSVSGYSFLNNTSYACEFSPHADWLAMLIAEPSLNHYGVDAFLAHVLWEMSYVSFDDSEVVEEFDFIKALADEIRESIENDEEPANFKVVEIPDDAKISDDEYSKFKEIMELNRVEMFRMLGIPYSPIGG